MAGGAIVNDNSLMDTFDRIIKVTIYQSYTDELKYIENSLNFIDKNIKTELKNLEDNFSKNIPHEALEKSIKEQHKSIQLTIIEGLFIRQIALVEKFFVNLACIIYSEEVKKSLKYRPMIYPPWYEEDKNKNKYFTDSRKAIKYLKETFSIDINEQKEWEIYNSMIEIRHRLAHGQKILEFKSEDAINTCNKYKNIGKILIPISNESKLAYLTTEIKPFINLSKSFIEIIQYSEKMTYEKYLQHYRPSKTCR